MDAVGSHVFLSHSQADSAHRDEIVRLIESHGIRVWWAPEHVPPGTDYSEATDEAIESCSAFVVIVTDTSNRSAHVRGETQLAFARGKDIFPVRVSDVQPAKGFRLFLNVRHWTDAFGPDRQERLAGLVRQLSGVINPADGGAHEGGPSSGTSGTKPAVNPDPAQSRRRLALISIASAVVVMALVALIAWPSGKDNAANTQAAAYRDVDMFGGDDHMGNAAADATSLRIPHDWSLAMPPSRLKGGAIALAEWRRAENRSQCAPAAFVADAGLEATPYARAVPGGWGVRLSLHLRDDAAGIAGRPMRPPTDEALRSWFAMAHLPRDGAVGWGPGGQIEMGVIEKWVAHIRIAGQQCTYEIWTTEGQDHLVRLVENFRLVRVE